MTHYKPEFDGLLSNARGRSQSAGSVEGLGQVTRFSQVSTLVSDTLRLSQLIATEKRDLKVIAAHHEIELESIKTAFRNIETTVLAAFNDNKDEREKVFEVMKLLIQAGEPGHAKELYALMSANKQKITLQSVVQAQSENSAKAGLKIEFK